MKKRIIQIAVFFTIVCALVVLPSMNAYARAGGGGGGSYGGGSGGGFSSYSSGGGGGGGESSGSVLIVFAVVIFIYLVIGIAKSKNTGRTRNGYKQLGPKTFDQIPGNLDFIKNNPEFDLDEFYAKVKKAFIEIQKAWCNGDIQTVRRFISDGIYQRFNTQLKMMADLKQKNVISDIAVNYVYIDSIDSDGAYDILHVAISAGMFDKFVCETNHELSSPGGREDFTEYWSFIRKRGTEGKDLYSTDRCPNCSAPLPEQMGDAGRCPYCKTFVNNGDYDWVLSEITQQDDYAHSVFAYERTTNLSAKVKELIEENTDFAVQEIEDKASNGYLQILTAITLKDPSIMRRFVTDDAYKKLSNGNGNSSIYYNRLYLNDVSLLAARQQDDKNILLVGVKSTFQRVEKVSETKALLVDPVLMTKSEVVVMQRILHPEASKGSLYARICSTCGAPLEDSMSIDCPYCNAVLNSSRNEWIIADIFPMAEYDTYLLQHAKDFTYQVESWITDGLASVKDYAFNNMLVIIASDGVFADAEKKLATELAIKWGFKIDKIQPTLNMAMSGRLSIRMPENGDKKAEIYKLMEQTACADDMLSEEEGRILEHIKETYAI